ncbi:hypothetical protein DRN69_01175 [Candidatus Pacearchaeota archaeon]|nr:MAG: hypothetical protein DRN69_01175 [Candidatus Pacearchaeota archaeon]
MINNRYTSFCFRCYHTWRRRKEKLPKVCPKCKSPYWNKPRKRASKEIVIKIKETIVNIHDAIIKLSGGERGIRDEGGIYNSTYKILNHQNKHRKNPTSLGAFILNELAKRHYFVDGNKRTAYVVCKVFMLVNKCHLKTEYSKSVKFMLDIAKYNSKITLEEIKKWLDSNCVLIKEKDVENYLNKVLVNLIIEVEKNG